MSGDGVDTSKRRFLTAAATVVGGIGAVYTAVPFLASWMPSERAKAAGAPVEADISKLETGQMIRVQWRGKPVWVLKRSEEMMAALPTLNPRLRDPESLEPQQPEYAQNEWRSIKPKILVAVGICTHLGCSPSFVPEATPQPYDPEWKGGFFCPCHGSRFDLAGRVFKGVPAPLNLEVPPYKYISNTLILVGDDTGAA
ncbi:ubiquinol-cytochrome c reductase iron-sulfur subunit [Thiogranum longum]|uniref:Ubiquinol-cytochrome c reductase iron-sulfur subunit n=1 Tax=Thiogranum longum TaxID=1537524 RepID=A0A4R1H7P0_9GAMM|nr:ubiquinol-cytochrome c reductase iron-sulfur subunit [Thiogranum longum]TCK17847.1 ubiquinol-cytochrome c reductase iron-sulfur subunit [Thiogranum longum]